MLKFIMRKFYHDKIYTENPELFYNMYKWCCGLHTLVSLRSILLIRFFGIVGIVCLIFIKPLTISSAFFGIALLLLILELKEATKQAKFEAAGMKTPKQIRTVQIVTFIRRFVSMNGRALSKKDWKAIKKVDIGLYNDLLCDDCNHCCYYYSLEIAKIIKDSILIWGAVEEPFEEGHPYYAHAVILRNGYIYDSNLRQSEKYEDFVNLYKFKLYKEWHYSEYSVEDFRKSEREQFRNWCKENNVLSYLKF